MPQLGLNGFGQFVNIALVIRYDVGLDGLAQFQIHAGDSVEACEKQIKDSHEMNLRRVVKVTRRQFQQTLTNQVRKEPMHQNDQLGLS